MLTGETLVGSDQPPCCAPSASMRLARFLCPTTQKLCLPGKAFDLVSHSRDSVNAHGLGVGRCIKQNLVMTVILTSRPVIPWGVMPTMALFIAGAFAAAAGPGSRNLKETRLQVRWFRVTSDACFGGSWGSGGKSKRDVSYFPRNLIRSLEEEI
jgi:hypothetical protein